MGEVKTNPYKTLIGQLLGWLHQLPVIDYNSGKYDLNVIKQFFVTYLMQDMPTGWYTRRREEKQFRPQQAQPFGQMAVQWLTWEAAKSGCAIRHQVNGREKRIGKLPVDGWCPEARIAYQFHGCFFHGCPKCYDQNETNSVNGKTMTTLFMPR